MMKVSGRNTLNLERERGRNVLNSEAEAERLERARKRKTTGPDAKLHRGFGGSWKGGARSQYNR